MQKEVLKATRTKVCQIKKKQEKLRIYNNFNMFNSKINFIGH